VISAWFIHPSVLAERAHLRPIAEIPLRYGAVGFLRGDVSGDAAWETDRRPVAVVMWPRNRVLAWCRTLQSPGRDPGNDLARGNT
jgi:hypothetical protein